LFCGYVGMTVSTYANVKTAAAAEIGLNRALRVAFTSGSVMGFTCVSMALISLSALLMIFDTESIAGIGALAGFGMGTSTVAIFARVGGGIFTKAADVGGDLVGKIGLGLPEDDVRNPATIGTKHEESGTQQSRASFVCKLVPYCHTFICMFAHVFLVCFLFLFLSRQCR